MSFLRLMQTLIQRLALVVFALLAVALVVSCVLAPFGVIPWLEWNLTWNGAPVPYAGMALQISLALIAVALCTFLPTNARVLALETSHRRFDIAMDDVAMAYDRVHRADREGTFMLSSQFEDMKGRLAYLTQHPDLGDLEPPLLELAAQMSFMSKELAETYSDENVERARIFLRQRQQEVTKFEKRLKHARVIADELKHWLHDVKMEEQLASAQLDELCEELLAILPELNMAPASKDSMRNGSDNKLIELNAQRV